MGNCGNKKCDNQAVEEMALFDEEGKRYAACEDCDNCEFSITEIEESAELECETCGGEGAIEEGPSCSRPASDCCGGCFTYHPCPDCGEDPPEPDWDDIREAREEARMEEGLNAEVEWESPY